MPLRPQYESRMPLNCGSTVLRISSGGIEYDVAVAQSCPGARGDHGLYSNNAGAYCTALANKPTTTLPSARPRRVTAACLGGTEPDASRANARYRANAPLTISRYCNSCGCGLSAASATTIAN